MSFVCIPVDGNDHQIGNAAVGCQRPPQRVHLTHDLPETPFHVDTHQCVDPRDPEQETEVGHRQRPDEYRHGVVLRRHRDLPDDHSQDQQVAGDADDEDGTRIESGNTSK